MLLLHSLPNGFTHQMKINEFSLMDYVQKVTLKTKTTNMAEMSRAVKKLTFGGGNERTFAGLKSALQQSPMHNFIVLISDELGDDTTDKALKADILKLRDATQSKVFFLMVPPNAATWKSMKTTFKDIGTVIDIKNTNTTIPQVVEALKKSAICNTQVATPSGSTTTPATTRTTTAPLTTRATNKPATTTAGSGQTTTAGSGKNGKNGNNGKNGKNGNNGKSGVSGKSAGR